MESWIASSLAVEVTRRRRIVSETGDLYTHHPNLSWEQSVIHGMITMGPAGSEGLAIGAVGSIDGVIRTADALQHLDRFDYEGTRYEIVSPPLEVRNPIGGDFLYRKAAFKRVEFEEP